MNRCVPVFAGTRRRPLKIWTVEAVHRGMKYTMLVFAALLAGCNAISGIDDYRAAAAGGGVEESDSRPEIVADATGEVADSPVEVVVDATPDCIGPDSIGPDSTGSDSTGPDSIGSDSAEVDADSDVPTCGEIGYVFPLLTYPPPAGSCEVCCLKKCTIAYSSGGKHYYTCCSGCTSY